jgi:hypothetical protein
LPPLEEIRMSDAETTPKKPANAPAPQNKGACQICGKVGGVIYDPEKAPPNRLCYRCATEYGMRDYDDE